MKNFLKYSMVAVATMALAVSVHAVSTQTLVISDGSGILAEASSSSGVVVLATNDSQWSVVVSTGTSYPPALGQGTASSPVMDLSITATYIGTGSGNPLEISFGSDGFGPSFGGVIATLTGHVVSGVGSSVLYSNFVASGSVLPNTGHPVIAGTLLEGSSIANIGGNYASTVAGGPLNQVGYSLDQVVDLTGSTNGSSYSIDASLVTTVPDGGMTLVLLGSALSGLALIKRKLA